MKKLSLISIPLAVVLVVVVAGIYFQPATASPLNLVNNGDFETPEVTNSSKWQIFSSDDVPAWTVEWAGEYGAPTPANLELHEGVLKPAYSGDQSVEMDTDWSSANGEPASVKIYQDIQTCVGPTYTLSYVWFPRPGHGDNAMEVYWGGTLVGNHSDSTSGSDWNLELIPDLTATTDTTRLEFIETATPDSLGMFLDAVSVEQIGECDLDGDDDGINDSEDLCPETAVDTMDLKPNRWMWDGDWQKGEIPGKGKAKGPDFTVSMEQTKGCSCFQILDWLNENYPEEYGEMNGHYKFGCSKSVIEDFISLVEDLSPVPSVCILP